MVEINDSPELIHFNRLTEHERATQVKPVPKSATDLSVFADAMRGEASISPIVESPAQKSSVGTLQTQTSSVPPSESPYMASRHFRFAITGGLVLLLFIVWIIQNRKRK